MKTLRRYLPVILWSAIIFLFSSWETPPSPQDTLLNFLLKKTAHLVEYAILYYLSFRAINHEVCETPTGSVKFRKLHVHYLYPLVFTILYAVSDEIHQSFVSGRHGRAADVLIDSAGALAILVRMKYAVLKSPLELKDKDKIVTLNQRWSHEKRIREK